MRTTNTNLLKKLVGDPLEISILVWFFHPVLPLGQEVGTGPVGIKLEPKSSRRVLEYESKVYNILVGGGEFRHFVSFFNDLSRNPLPSLLRNRR